MTVAIDPGADDDELEQPSDDAATVRRILWFAGVIVALLLIRSFVVEPVRVRSDSMEPTVPSGAILLIDKFSYLIGDPDRGDVVVAANPLTGESIVKRVVAVGGDSVGIEDGQLIVNGTSVVEDYIDNAEMDGFFTGPDVVPPGQVYLLGDNRDTSEDSRVFGPVDVDDVEGRVIGTIWPL